VFLSSVINAQEQKDGAQKNGTVYQVETQLGKADTIQPFLAGSGHHIEGESDHAQRRLSPEYDVRMNGSQSSEGQPGMDPQVRESKPNPAVLSQQDSENKPDSVRRSIRVNEAGETKILVNNPVDVGLLNRQWFTDSHGTPFSRPRPEPFLERLSFQTVYV